MIDVFFIGFSIFAIGGLFAFVNGVERLRLGANDE